MCTDVINIEHIPGKRDTLFSNQITCLLIINRSEMAHPQKDDHANVPFQDPGRLCGSVLREKQDSDQQVAEGGRIQWF